MFDGKRRVVGVGHKISFRPGNQPSCHPREAGIQRRSREDDTGFPLRGNDGVARGNDGSCSLLALSFLRVRHGECRSQALRQLHRIIVRPEVHEEKSRLLVEQMIVEARHFDSAFAQ